MIWDSSKGESFRERVKEKGKEEIGSFLKK